jgi:hypothetical protein
VRWLIGHVKLSETPAQLLSCLPIPAHLGTSFGTHAQACQMWFDAKSKRAHSYMGGNMNTLNPAAGQALRRQERLQAVDQRQRDADDAKLLRCGYCDALGHNRRTCPVLKARHPPARQ